MRIHYLAESVIVSDDVDPVAVVRTATAMARRGHDVVVQAPLGSGSDAEAFAYYGVPPLVRLLRHPTESAYLRPETIVAEGPAAAIARRARRLLRERRTTAAAVRADRPDLLYVRNVLAMPWIPRDTPFVFEAHQPPPARRAVLDRAMLRRPGLRRVVTISDALRSEYLRRFPWLEGRIVVAHDAADDPVPAGEDWRPRRRGPGEPLRVGYVGSLYPGRGGEELVAVAERLPDVRFDLVGGSEADLARLSAAGVPSNVTLHGHVPPSTLASHYERCDVLVAPYQRSVAVHGGTGDTSRWMSPMKLFEYLSWGRPMVFSDLPVLREVLRDGENALLVPPDDVAAWVAAIARLREDAGLSERLATRARTDFLAHHTWDRRAATVLAGLE
ncbi:MAG: glycosyltransferase family 4 protein [Nitriliruptoraceae bacterium]